MKLSLLPPLIAELVRIGCDSMFTRECAVSAKRRAKRAAKLLAAATTRLALGSDTSCAKPRSILRAFNPLKGVGKPAFSIASFTLSHLICIGLVGSAPVVDQSLGFTPLVTRCILLIPASIIFSKPSLAACQGK